MPQPKEIGFNEDAKGRTFLRLLLKPDGTFIESLANRELTGEIIKAQYSGKASFRFNKNSTHGSYAACTMFFGIEGQEPQAAIQGRGGNPRQVIIYVEPKNKNAAKAFLKQSMIDELERYRAQVNDYVDRICKRLQK